MCHRFEWFKSLWHVVISQQSFVESISASSVQITSCGECVLCWRQNTWKCVQCRTGIRIRRSRRHPDRRKYRRTLMLLIWWDFQPVKYLENHWWDHFQFSFKWSQFSEIAAGDTSVPYIYYKQYCFCSIFPMCVTSLALRIPVWDPVDSCPCLLSVLC